MFFNALLFPALFVTSGVLAQQTGVATSYTPDVTYTEVDYTLDSFVFCSAQNCAGTCEVVNLGDSPADDGHAPPNDMGYLSMYWYNPEGTGGLDVYTCIEYENCGNDVLIGPNTCYNLYDNGVATDFYWYWYFIIGGYGFLFLLLFNR